MVKIRLRRVGAKKQASFRVVVADSRSPRDGRNIEEIGFYNPRTEPETLRIKEERALYWLSVGAQPTDSMKRLLTSSGTLQRFERLKQGEALEALVIEAEEARIAALEAVDEAEEAEMEAPEPVDEAEEEEEEAPEPVDEAEEEEEETPEPVDEAEEEEEEAPEPVEEAEEEEEEAETEEVEPESEADETEEEDEPEE